MNAIVQMWFSIVFCHLFHYPCHLINQTQNRLFSLHNLPDDWNENGEVNGANAIVIESNRPQTKQKLICTLNKSEHEALNNRQTGWKIALKVLHAHTVCEMCIVYVRTQSSEAPAKHTDLLNERHLHFFSLLKFAFVAFFFIVFQLMLLLGFFPLTSSKHRWNRSVQEDIAKYLQIEWMLIHTVYDIVCGKGISGNVCNNNNSI